MSQILVVGSLAYDSIKTPSGVAPRTLGGSANYFSLAASHFSKVRVVGVVGEDYDSADKALLISRGVDLSGVETVKGKTFHWEGFYEGDLNEAQTLKTELNVFEHFQPKLPSHYSDSQFVFLANIAPELQLQVLEQVKNPLFVGMDTMNFWITSKKEILKKVIERVNVVLINEKEAEMLTGAENAIAAAPIIASWGPQAVIIKRGEYGFAMYHRVTGFFILPAVPIQKIIDPTGAGDSFAGGFFGHIAQVGAQPTPQTLRQACIQGTLLSSFTIQDFGTKAISNVTAKAISDRKAEYLRVIQS